MAKEQEKQDTNTPKPGERVLVDASIVGELVKARVEAELSKLQAIKPEPNDPTMRRLMEADRENASPKTVTYKPAFSHRTRARFTAKIVASRRFPQGRIVDIGVTEDGARDYVEPAEYTKHVDDGGLVPNTIAIRTNAGGLTREYMKWKAQNNCWIQDLQEFVGKPWLDFFSPPAHLSAPAEKVA